MKKNLIALLLAVVMTSGSIGTAPVMAAETGVEETETGAEEAIVVGEETEEAEEIVITEGSGTIEDTLQSEDDSEIMSEETKVEDVSDTEVIQDGIEANTSDIKTMSTAGAADSYGIESGNPSKSSNLIECKVSYDPNGGEFIVAHIGAGPGDIGSVYGLPTELPEDPKAILTTTVTYKSWDGGASFVPANVRKQGYRFAGWSTTKDGEAEDLVHKLKITKDITVYAVWEEFDEAGSCGMNTEWTLRTTGNKLILTINGSGDMYNYGYGGEPAPWGLLIEYSDEEFHTSITEKDVINQVIIEDGITSIGAAAFRGLVCNNVTIPESVTSIGNYAFAYSSGLTSIIIPESVTSIGVKAFMECSGLTSIIIPESVTTFEESIPDYEDEKGNAFTYYQGTILVYSGSPAEAYCEAKGLNYKIICKEHTWNEEYTVDKEATYTEEGSESIHCSVCGEIKEGTSRVIPKLQEHEYGDWNVTKEATCTEEGSREKVCADCGDTITETIPATGHVWNEDYTIDKEATCTEEGSESIHCSVCNATDESTVTVIPKTDHTYGDWTVTKEATCTEEGTQEKICTVCGDKVTETIPVIPHSWNTEYTVDKEATCTEEGSESIHCSACDEIDETTVRAIEKREHAYGDWAIIKEATCTEAGSIEKVCAYCGDKVTETIPVIPHSWNTEYTVDKEATCTEEGSESIHCSVCDEIDETTARAIEKKDHAYSDWIVTKEATCTEEGEREKICSACENKVTEVISATGHKWNSYYTIDEAPTITTEGSKSIHCSVCDEINPDSVQSIAKLTGAWKKTTSGWWYDYGDGSYPKSKFENISGKTYYFNSSGYMVTGWQKIDGAWYYFSGSGAMATGWQSIGGKWYYFSGSGAMQTGLQKINGKTYYFSAGGAMATGWQKINNKWYYFSAGGAMLTGWQKISNKWYYFDANGAMLTGWQSIGGKWYYFEGSGVMAANKWVGNYYLTASGAMATNTWIGKYYVGADGKWIPNYKAAG